MDLGHWTTELPDFEIDDFFGFVYRVINVDTNQMYIGKKQFWKVQRKKVKGRKNRKIVTSESDWKKYTTSSKWINLEIDEHGKDRFIFIIESLHVTKGSLYYREVEVQVKENVMREKLPCGKNKYYNKNIASVKFMPPDETLLESQFKVC